VWAPTQDLDGAHLTVSKAAGLPLEKCFVYRFDPGGGFGRRGRVSDFATQAVEIARQFPGIPIKMIWTREEDMAHGQYRPISQCKFTAGLDANNNVTGMHIRMSGQSINAWTNPSAIIDGYKDDRQLQGWYAQPGDQQLGYEIPNLLIEYAIRNTHVPVGTWRGVNIPQNGFYMECFIEEVARAAGIDSLEFRRRLARNFPNHLAILDTIAEKGNWGKPTPRGVYRGMAQVMSYGTYSAATAEVSVAKNGDVKVHRIVLAVNVGHAVNPGQIAAQIEGSIAYGLSATLWGENTVERGRIVESNFHNYRVLRLAEMPKVETVIVANGDFWGGIGEPTISVVAPAVVNAVSLALGRPLRDLPLKNQKLA
jgi:isoquinoline 1-oxidoreductase beta subunit